MGGEGRDKKEDSPRGEDFDTLVKVSREGRGCHCLSGNAIPVSLGDFSDSERKVWTLLLLVCVCVIHVLFWPSAEANL